MISLLHTGKPHPAKRTGGSHSAVRGIVRTLSAALAISSVLSAHAASNPVLYSLIIPESHVKPGSTVTVELVALNTSAKAVDLTFPRIINACMRHETTTAHMKMYSKSNPVTRSLAAGHFEMQQYTCDLPNEFTNGQAVIELTLTDANRLSALLDLRASEMTSDSQAAEKESAALTPYIRKSQASVDSLQSIFLDRLSPYEPIYFIYGHDCPEAKFQFSLKYRLMDFGVSNKWKTRRTLQFGFTQRSLWDVKGPSSPFYDTSYMPEIFYEVRPLEREHGDGINWLGIQTAYKHESNGRDGDASRTMNVVYLRACFSVGDLSKWHLLLIPEIQTYVSSFNDVPGLRNYRGNGKLLIVIGCIDGPAATTMLWAGADFEHPSVQVDLTIPVHTRLLDFGTCLLVQYFNGYGESLLSYREQTETIRAGIELIR